MESIGDYNEIMNDRNLFNKVVYTPLSEALRLLEERQKDPVLVEKVTKLLNGDIPEVLKPLAKNAIQFRQIATPNNDSRHFISICQDHDLQSIFFEYSHDKFTSNNEYKHSLGQLRVAGLVNKSNYYPIEKITVVDFNKYNGKCLSEVFTLWNESLKDFHQKLFLHLDYEIDKIKFYDASEWFKNNGGKASEYYKNFFLLFVCHGILFENFLIDDIDGQFSQQIVLPALDDVLKSTGLKPLIVPIGPLDMETDDHWIAYEPSIKTIIPKI